MSFKGYLQEALKAAFTTKEVEKVCKAFFKEMNPKLFEGKLKFPKITFNNTTKKNFGSYSRKTKELSLSYKLFNNEHEIKKTFCHECIHIYQDQVLNNISVEASMEDPDGKTGHGPSFKLKMKKANALWGENFVTIDDHSNLMGRKMSKPLTVYMLKTQDGSIMFGTSAKYDPQIAERCMTWGNREGWEFKVGESDSGTINQGTKLRKTFKTMTRFPLTLPEHKEMDVLFSSSPKINQGAIQSDSMSSKKKESMKVTLYLYAEKMGNFDDINVGYVKGLKPNPTLNKKLGELNKVQSTSIRKKWFTIKTVDLNKYELLLKYVPEIQTRKKYPTSSMERLHKRTDKNLLLQLKDVFGFSVEKWEDLPTGE